jgi:hypothetical protein
MRYFLEIFFASFGLALAEVAQHFLKQGLPNQGVQCLPNNQFSLANSAVRSA